MTLYFETRKDFEKYTPALTGKDNKRICLSAKRYVGRCYECPVFETKKGICESALIIKDEVGKKEALIEKKKQLKAEIKIIENALNKV